MDLYSYANGDPINNQDLNGRFSTAVYDTVTGVTIADIVKSISPPYCLDIFETVHCPFNGSHEYDLSEFGRPELPDGLSITFINGIWNFEKNALESAFYLSDLSGGYNIHGVYGATQGSVDPLTCALGLSFIDTGRMKHLHAAWDKAFQKNKNGYHLHICHSRGATDTRNALLSYPEELRKRIIVVALAPAAYIYSHTCAQVTHYRVDSPSRDPVPYIDRIGAARERNTIVDLPPHPESGIVAHGLMDIIFRMVTAERVDEYIQKRGRL
jgi:hypothetical protein